MVLASCKRDWKSFLRSPDLRGRKPSKLNLSVGRPETARAANTADGPGITLTSIPASIAALTRTKPGSETVGIPASLTTNTSSVTAISRSCSTLSASLCSWRLKSFASSFTPKPLANLSRVLVSSAAMNLEDPKCSINLAEASERLPIGVAARMSTLHSPN